MSNSLDFTTVSIHIVTHPCKNVIIMRMAKLELSLLCTDVNMLESSEFQSATVSGFGDEENMCQLSLEWSEDVVSCSGDVPYTVTATPCLSGSGDCEVISGSPVETFSTTQSRITLSVNGSVGLEYDFTVSTCANTSDVYTVNLTGEVDIVCVHNRG